MYWTKISIFLLVTKRKSESITKQFDLKYEYLMSIIFAKIKINRMIEKKLFTYNSQNQSKKY